MVGNLVTMMMGNKINYVSFNNVLHEKEMVEKKGGKKKHLPQILTKEGRNGADLI